MRDPIRDIIEQLGGDYQAYRRAPIEPWQRYVSLVIFVPLIALAAFWAFNALFALARSEYATPSAVAYVVVPLLAFCAGFIAYFLRDVVKTLAYPIIEIGIGLAAAAQAVLPSPNDLPRLIALLAGVRIIADGIMRFFKFSEKGSKQ